MDAVSFLAAVQGAGRPDLPPGHRLATIDAAYTTTYPTVTLPYVTFDGEPTMSLKQYPILADYTPQPGDRVLMAPVGRTYVIVGAIQTNAAVTRPDAQYHAASDQTINHNSAAFVAFGTTDRSTAFVTRAVSATGHVFTLQRTGKWTITVTVAFAGANNGVREAWIEGPSGRYTSNSHPGRSDAMSTLHMSLTDWFTAGGGYAVTVYQNSGIDVALAANNANAWGRINFLYHGTRSD